MRPMAEAAPPAIGYTGEEYFSLVDAGVLQPDDRVELLDGVIVAMSPHNPRHASAIARLNGVLNRIVGSRAVVRVQLPLIAGTRSIPEPDISVVEGTFADYDRKHPATALLVVEVADASLAQDRLSKAAIYAAAGVPEYWLINLRDDCVEVLRRPDMASRRYVERRVAGMGDTIELLAFPATPLRVEDLIPARD